VRQEYLKAYQNRLWEPPSESVREAAEKAFWEWEALKSGTGVVRG